MHSLAGMLSLSYVIHSNPASGDIGDAYGLPDLQKRFRIQIYWLGCQCFPNTFNKFYSSCLDGALVVCVQQRQVDVKANSKKLFGQITPLSSLFLGDYVWQGPTEKENSCLDPSKSK